MTNKPLASQADEILDTIDREILRALPADGRIANLKLAEAIGLSPTAALARVRGWSATASCWTCTCRDGPPLTGMARARQSAASGMNCTAREV